jgi:hypothetical protein
VEHPISLVLAAKNDQDSLFTTPIVMNAIEIEPESIATAITQRNIDARHMKTINAGAPSIATTITLNNARIDKLARNVNKQQHHERHETLSPLQ